MKFTVEIEKDSVIPFSDILVTKTPNRIHWTVYSKKRILIYIFIGIYIGWTRWNGDTTSKNKLVFPN